MFSISQSNKISTEECLPANSTTRLQINGRSLMQPPPPDLLRARKRIRSQRVHLMHSLSYEKLCDLVEANGGRDSMLYSLLDACGLMRKLTVVTPALAAASHMENFHSSAYIKALQNPPEDLSELSEFGLLDDCEVFRGLWRYCCAVAGASLQAASLLVNGTSDVSINWGGGRHHATRSMAAGICYINDCVLAIIHLLKRYTRVLYVDVDIHHPNGVQDAFYQNDTVFCLSFHHWSAGFYPHPAGDPNSIGRGKGLGYTLNVPLMEGCTDGTFKEAFFRIFEKTLEAFRPNCIVLQCGADGLGGDPIGVFNLTTRGLQDCVRTVISRGLPTLVLGGGGYNEANASRLWTILTATIIGEEAEKDLPETIPGHEYFHKYGPAFDLHTMPMHRKDANDHTDIESFCDDACIKLEELKQHVFCK